MKCHDCSNEAEPGRRRCISCRDKHRRRNRKSEWSAAGNVSKAKAPPALMSRWRSRNRPVGGKSASARQRGNAPPPIGVPLNRAQREAAGVADPSRSSTFIHHEKLARIEPVFKREAVMVGRPLPTPAVIVPRDMPSVVLL